MSLQALWREVTQWNCAVRRAENENAKVRHGQLIRSGRQHLDQRVPTHLSRKEPHKDSYRTRRSFWSGCVSDANCPDTSCLQNSDCEVTFSYCFNDTAIAENHTLSLHDALPIFFWFIASV